MYAVETLYTINLVFFSFISKPELPLLASVTCWPVSEDLWLALPVDLRRQQTERPLLECHKQLNADANPFQCCILWFLSLFPGVW